jgi:hypothetical protein
MEKPRRVGGIYDIFITEDMRFGFLARKPNLISSEFWGSMSKETLWLCVLVLVASEN